MEKEVCHLRSTSVHTNASKTTIRWYKIAANVRESEIKRPTLSTEPSSHLDDEVGVLHMAKPYVKLLEKTKMRRNRRLLAPAMFAMNNVGIDECHIEEAEKQRLIKLGKSNGSLQRKSTKHKDESVPS
jgi:hypothetical protein